MPNKISISDIPITTGGVLSVGKTSSIANSSNSLNDGNNIVNIKEILAKEAQANNVSIKQDFPPKSVDVEPKKECPACICNCKCGVAKEQSNEIKEVETKNVPQNFNYLHMSVVYLNRNGEIQRLIREYKGNVEAIIGGKELTGATLGSIANDLLIPRSFEVDSNNPVFIDLFYINMDYICNSNEKKFWGNICILNEMGKNIEKDKKYSSELKSFGENLIFLNICNLYYVKDSTLYKFDLSKVISLTKDNDYTSNNLQRDINSIKQKTGLKFDKIPLVYFLYFPINCRFIESANITSEFGNILEKKPDLILKKKIVVDTFVNTTTNYDTICTIVMGLIIIALVYLYFYKKK